MQRSDRQRQGERHHATHDLAGTNLERAGDYNQRVTLQAIRVNGQLTRVDLAKLTGLGCVRRSRRKQLQPRCMTVSSPTNHAQTSRRRGDGRG